MYGFAAEACCSTELVEADANPFWIGAAGPLGGKADFAFGLRLLLSQYQPLKNISKEELFDRGVVLNSIRNNIQKHVPIRETLRGSHIRREERILRAW